MNRSLLCLLVAVLGIAAVRSAPQSVPAASATSSTPDVAEAMNEIIGSFKHIMPCGDPAMKLPAMEPFRLPIISLDINHELLVLNGDIKNMVLTGLSNFVIIELSTNATNGRTTYDMLYKDVQLLGEYNLYVNADLAGYKFVVNLFGLMNLQVMDLRVSGGITIGTNAAGGMVFSDLTYYIDVGDVVSHNLDTQWSIALNDYFNKYVRDTSLLWLQSNREFLNEVLSNYFMNKWNPAVAKVTLNEYIQGMVSISQKWYSETCVA